LSDLPLGSLLRQQVRTSLAELGLDTTVVSRDIGYELRCAKPIPFDIEYTRTLGYGAVRYLLEGGSGALIAITGGRITPVALEQLEDKQTGRIRVRTVDVATESYQVARSYMIRLEASDLGGESVKHLAAVTTLSPRAFHERFLPVVLSTVSVPLHGNPSVNDGGG
jgi:ATP-dependent phosphofructokinase / diphosphate-dependent phosphofructokinase